MTKPKFIRAISDALHVHASTPGVVTIQQGDILVREGVPDSTIHLDREAARQVAAALAAFLSMHTDPLELYFYTYTEEAAAVKATGTIGPFADYQAAYNHGVAMMNRYPHLHTDLPLRMTSPVLDPATAE